MIITSSLFEAHLKCSTKSFLRSVSVTGHGNDYADWVRSQNEQYRDAGVKQLMEKCPQGEIVTGPLGTEDLKTAEWRLAVNMVIRGQNFESTIHAVERVTAEGRGQAAQFIPIRFVPANKLSTDDKLLLAFDALVLSEVLGQEVVLGKIIHGDDYTALKIKTRSLAGGVRKIIGKISALLSEHKPPALTLNRHCAECEFRDHCRPKAIEKDDLSLIPGLSQKEILKLNKKGIFSVTQLSCTFRPRRRPKRLRDKQEKYHHSLKALAIRDKKIHIVGKPELKIDGTPVYLDVEGLPDSGFYYLIGARVGTSALNEHHSFWAADIGGEDAIWKEFLGLLAKIEKPVLIHYGSYETTFLRRMGERCPRPDIRGNCVA